MKAAALVALLLLPAPLAAQGLGDAAAKERQKRQQQAKPAPTKVFTDADLSTRAAPSDPGGEGPEQSSRAAPSEPGGEPRETDDDSRGEGSAMPPDPSKADPLERERQERKLLEAEWRVRFANAREQVALAEAACWQDVVRTQFHQGIPVQMKVKEFVESEELRRAKKALADLEEEFRRTGLPPGWARES